MQMGAIDYIDVKKATINILRDWHDQNWKLDNAPAEFQKSMTGCMLSSQLPAIPLRYREARIKWRTPCANP